MTAPRPNRTQAAGHSAIVWMLGAVGGYALLPWMVWAGVQDMSPWLFTAVWYVAYGVLYATVRQITADYGERGDGWLVMLADLRAAKRVLVGLLALFQMAWLLFAAAVVLADPSVVTVIFESWPMLFGLITVSNAWREWMLDGDEPDLNDQQSGVAPMLLMLVVGVVGVGLVVFSDAESLTWSGQAPFGLLLAGVAALAGAAGAATQQAIGEKQQHVTRRDLTAVSTSGNAAAQLLAVPLLWVVAVVVSEGDLQFTTRGMLLSVAAGAAQMAGNWCLHHANHLAREAHGKTAASINSLYYLVPVAALLLLAAFADTDIDRPDLLIAGVAGVVAVNMILHLDPEGTKQRRGGSGHGYKAAVLALWGAGTLVLFRDDWLPQSWQVWSVIEYWGLVGVLATVFTLILAFRQTRLAERRRDMDRLLLELYQRVAFMGSTGELPAAAADTAIKLLDEIDTAGTQAPPPRSVGRDQPAAPDARAGTARPSCDNLRRCPGREALGVSGSG